MARSADVLIVTALAVAATSPANAADRQMISIAPTRLGEAVVALGRQTGASIGMSDQSLAGLATPAIKGRLSVETALRRLLRGTNARAERINASTWRIVRAPATPAPAVVARARSAIPEPPPPAEIVVTASKRDVPLPRYPGVVEALGYAPLTSAEAAAGTATLLSRVASLSSTHAGPGRNKLFLRAIADSAIAGPTQATTGQYLGDMRLNYAAPDPDLRLYDMQGVEVLEGPQGTLYGAGSLGGIIRLVPNPPNLARIGGQMSTGLSFTQHGDPGGDVSATLNVPIVPERLALRLVGYGVREGGYIDDLQRRRNDVNRTDIYGGRAALRFAPNEDWVIDLTGLYQRIDGDDAQYADRTAGPLDRRSSLAQPSSSDYALGNVRIERQWDDLHFVSSTGYVRNSLTESYDATQPYTPPALFTQHNRVSIFSTENRLTRDRENGLGWIVGLSYLESISRLSRSLASFGPGFVEDEIIPGVPLYGSGTPAVATGVRNRIREATIFGETSFEPVAGLVATLGGRLTNSSLSGEAVDPVALLARAEIARAEAEAKRHETIFLPSISLLSDAISGLTLYARYQQGFRPGGLAVDDQHVRRFSNDRASTLEFGFRKGVSGGDLVAISGNFAYTDWRDIQADVIDRIGLPATANIGDGRIFTVEGRIVVRPLPTLSIDGSFIYNDSRLKRAAPYVQALVAADKSMTLPNVANLGARIAIDYRARLSGDMTLHLNGSARYVGKSRLGVGPVLGRDQGDYVDTAMSASVSRGPLQLSLSLSNLLDDRGNRFSLGTPFNLRGDYVTPMRPRTIRMGMDFAF